MRVRQKNPILKAVQFTFDNAEQMQHDFGGRLLWGERVEGMPQPILELSSRRTGGIPSCVRVNNWIITNFHGELLEVVSDEYYQREFVPEPEEINLDENLDEAIEEMDK